MRNMYEPYLDIGSNVPRCFEPTIVAEVPAGAKDACHAAQRPEEGEEDAWQEGRY